MATYAELSDLLANNQGLRSKAVVAGTIKSEAIFAEVSPTATRLQWAEDTLSNPDGRGILLLAYILAANDSVSVAAIVGASDASTQANVDMVIDKIAV